MGTKNYEIVKRTKEEIFEAYDACKNGGTPGYSEKYPSFPTECKLTDGTTGWYFDVKEYYG